MENDNLEEMYRGDWIKHEYLRNHGYVQLMHPELYGNLWISFKLPYVCMSTQYAYDLEMMCNDDAPMVVSENSIFFNLLMKGTNGN